MSGKGRDLSYYEHELKIRLITEADDQTDRDAAVDVLEFWMCRAVEHYEEEFGVKWPREWKVEYLRGTLHVIQEGVNDGSSTADETGAKEAEKDEDHRA